MFLGRSVWVCCHSSVVPKPAGVHCSGQPIIEIGLQFLDRAIELLAESDIVELVLEGSAGMFSDAVGPRRIGPGVIHILDGQAELVGVILNLAHNIPLLRRPRVCAARPHQLHLSRRSKRQFSSRRRGGPPITGAEIRSCLPADNGFPGSRGAYSRMCSPKSRSRLRRRWFSCSTTCPCSLHSRSEAAVERSLSWSLPTVSANWSTPAYSET